MRLKVKLPKTWRKPGLCGVALIAGLAISANFISHRYGVIETHPERAVAAVAVATPTETSERQPPSDKMLELGRVLFFRVAPE